MDNILSSSNKANPMSQTLKVRSDLFNSIPADKIVGEYEYNNTIYPKLAWGDIKKLYPDMWVTLYAPGFSNREETVVSLIDLFDDSRVEEKTIYYRRLNRKFMCWRTIEHFMGGIW